MAPDHGQGQDHDCLQSKMSVIQDKMLSPGCSRSRTFFKYLASAQTLTGDFFLNIPSRGCLTKGAIEDLVCSVGWNILQMALVCMHSHVGIVMSHLEVVKILHQVAHTNFKDW